ncbi:transcription factor jumonji aspartyl beta-hydroxylase [Stemphylium lycopersici]|nr:transcription factor jumonji aspartyl beta-hydroxylase [Stemphylium lycopersici]
MPAARPRASFEPIPPDFDVRTFVENAENFQYVDRISYEMIATNGVEAFEKLVLLHVIIGGKPLVIDGFEEVLDPWTFTPSWLRDNHGDKGSQALRRQRTRKANKDVVENARNLTAKENIPLTIKHYLKHMTKLTEQFFDAPDRYLDKKRQRIYLKDIDCPQVWHDKLKEHIPSSLFYLNDSTGEQGGPGALDEFGGRKCRGIGRAGDLMSSLPPDMRAENLMCYIGHEGTYTPSHREMCASLGQNIMVNASTAISEDGKPERPGSSIWFMTESKERHVVSEYWLSILGHDIEVENHFAQLIAWKKAPFQTYVVEQRPGDFILIPPLAPHQVWNRGTRTMKIAWNRTTVETLELALNEALPNSRVVCRDEQYKNKAIIYYTLLKYSSLIKLARAQIEAGGEQAEAIQRSVKVKQVQKDFKRLFDLYKIILLSEMLAPDSREHPEFLPYDSNVTCAYCRCNIFNRFLSCKSCYTWVEQWKWKDLTHKYEEWRAQIIDIDGYVNEKTPLSLQEERRYLGKKTLAHVCQEQLRVRPIVDPKSPPPESASEDEEPVVDAYGNVKKTSNKKSKQWMAKHKSCHFCLHRHPKWKMAFCSSCDLAYCYGTLFRAHDMMPISVMEAYNWKCPHCMRVCNTGACRRDPRQHPYEPKGTLLGHDTKKVADIRSVECLVDFSVSNLNWFRQEEGMVQSAMQRRMQQAEMDKLADPSLDARFTEDDERANTRYGITYSPVEDVDRTINDYRGGFPRPSQVGDANGDSHYHDPNLDGEIPRLGQKHGRDEQDDADGSRCKKTKNKKQKKKDDEVQSLQPKNASGKQYQREMHRKLLEEAKREDRFILVAARIKGKSKVVKLSLATGHLDRIRQRPVPERTQVLRQSTPEELDVSAGMQSIIRSDVIPKPSAPKTIAEKERDAKTYRVRIEADEAYSTRKRKPETSGPAKFGRPRTSKLFEEITLDSDEFATEDEETECVSRPRGRASNWLARRNEGEEDLPTELPADFRDGAARPDRQKVKERNRVYKELRQTMPTKPTIEIRPSGGPAETLDQDRIPNISGHTSDQDGAHEEDNQTSEAVMLAKQAAAAALEARAEAEAREAEENLRAKMAIFPESDDEEQLMDNFLGDLDAEDEIPEVEVQPEVSLPKPMHNGPLPPTNSILSGLNGKKIKIFGSSNRNGTGRNKATPSASKFKPVNRKPQSIDISDTESEDEIPATAPTPKKPVGRPPSRPSMAPARGSSFGTRGREVLDRYPATVPEKLRNLDAQRYDVIPATVASRDESDKKLTKTEVEKLVEWKLKHGTFRPALLGLVQSNTAQAVEETTKKAYAALWDSKSSYLNTTTALKILVGLKGIGPATASLLLSVLWPAQIPFFSDEMFRWCCWDNEIKGREDAGWQRKIKYNIKEYEMVLDAVEKLRMRLRKGLGEETDTSASALDVERVAWVLGKERKDVGIVEENGEKEGADDAEEQIEEADETQEIGINDDINSEEKITRPVAKIGRKRKAVEAKPRAEGTRKSTRTKK